MKHKKLGRTEITVSEMCLGTMTWGSQNTQEDVDRQIGCAIDRGVNFIDTAEMYPTTPRSVETIGRSEELLGDWISRHKDRGDIVISTKATGADDKLIRNGQPLNGKTIREALEGSLRRLNTDYIDLYHLHWPNRGSYHFRRYWDFDPRDLKSENMEQEVHDILGEIDLLINEGKIRAFGLSNESAWGVMKFLEASRSGGLPRVSAVQCEYSLLCRIFDLDMAEISVQEDVGLMGFSPLAMGTLTGKHLAGEVEQGSRAAMFPDLKGRFVPQAIEAVKAYVEVADHHGISPSTLALAFCRSRPFMMSVIVGGTKTEHIESNLAAASVDLDDQVLRDIEDIHRQFPRPM